MSKNITYTVIYLLQTLSDEAAKVMYQMKRASSVDCTYSNTAEVQRKPLWKKKKALVEGT